MTSLTTPSEERALIVKWLIKGALDARLAASSKRRGQSARRDNESNEWFLRIALAIQDGSHLTPPETK